MNLVITSTFNTSIFRLGIDGCARSIIPKILLVFERCIPPKTFLPDTGDFAPDSVILSIFKENIEIPWNYKTLAQIGTPTANATTPVVYVDFPTSVENTAIYIYNKLFPLYKEKNVTLVSVKVFDDLFFAEAGCM